MVLSNSKKRSWTNRKRTSTKEPAFWLHQPWLTFRHLQLFRKPVLRISHNWSWTWEIYKHSNMRSRWSKNNFRWVKKVQMMLLSRNPWFWTTIFLRTTRTLSEYKELLSRNPWVWTIISLRAPTLTEVKVNTSLSLQLTTSKSILTSRREILHHLTPTLQLKAPVKMIFRISKIQLTIKSKETAQTFRSNQPQVVNPQIISQW